MKFGDEYKKEFLPFNNVLDRVHDLTNGIGKQLSLFCKQEKLENKFYNSAVQFCRINFESLDSIKNLIANGNIIESYVLLRWKLELAHLFYYLWKNESEYLLWIDGKEIKPKKIGQFFDKNGLASWEETYSEWSNVVHGNSIIIENCYHLSKSSPVSKGQLLIARSSLLNLIVISHKINSIAGSILKEKIEIEIYNPIAEEYNELEVEIEKLIKIQLSDEDDLMNDE